LYFAFWKTIESFHAGTEFDEKNKYKALRTKYKARLIMSTAVKQFHEEEAIGKTYDLQVARRLLRYLKPYVRLLIPALILTLLLNLLGILQPKFTQYAIDWFIIPRVTKGITLFALAFVGVQLVRFVFSYFQAVLLNSVGQYVMFDLRREIYHKLQHQEVAYYDRNPVGRIHDAIDRRRGRPERVVHLRSHRCAWRPGDDHSHHWGDGLDGRASDAGHVINSAVALNRDHLVSQRRAPWL